MKKYDVIIVGAGPGGLNCADKLCNSDKKVLLLEKNEVIGPKICAGGFTGHDMKYLDLPSKLIGNKFKEAIFQSRFIKGKLKLDDYFVFTIDRTDLGQWQLKKLKNTEIEIRTKSRVTKVAKKYLALVIDKVKSSTE